MKAEKYVKIDGVSINREWVTKMTKKEFVNHPQVIGLFYRIKEGDRSGALSVIYETITGKKSKSSSSPAPAPVVEKETLEEDPSDNN